MDGYELAGRFSYITNALNYCGPEDSHKHFHHHITAHDGNTNTADNREKIRDAIKKFEALYPYLKFIAEKTGKDFMDYEVVEAYWMGNDLLEKFHKEDMQELVRMLMKRGLPPTIGNPLIAKMPYNAIPFHTFHVFYVGVGNVTGHVKTTIPNMDNCRISVGNIVDIIDTHLIVQTDTIIEKDGKLGLAETTKTIVFDPKMIVGAKLHDYIAIHWGFACKKLDQREVDNIRKYTLQSIELKNST